MAKRITWKGRRKAKAIDVILEKITSGQSVRKILGIDRDSEILPSAGEFNKWLLNSDELKEQYARACAQRAELIFEEILQIADDSSGDTKHHEDGNTSFDQEFAARSRIRIDARKWMLSKMQPKKYGDKIDVTTGGESLNYQPIWGKIDPVLDD